MFGLLLLAACESTPRTLVVLLPEANGKVGKVVVTNKGGSTTLDKADAATDVASASAAPGKAYQIKNEQVQSIFKAALAAQPDPPLHFLLYFHTDRTRMTAASRAKWPQILAEIRRRKSPDIGIVGHTDRAGPASYNEPLSRRRARIIRKRLIDAGIDPAIIDISWLGEKDPLIPTADGVAEPRNRRVEVIIR